MATPNFDTQIKQQLEQRSLEPSPKSWEQLRSKLDKKDTKTKPIFWWLGIAASFLGGILIMAVFFNSKETATNPIVIQDKIQPNSENMLNPIVEAIPLANEKEETTPPAQIVATQKVKTTQKPKTNQSLAQQEMTGFLENDFSKKTTSTAQHESQKEKIIDEVLASSNPKKKVTDTEIDALLNEAFAKISKEKLQSNPVITSSDLLDNVEDEIEESFRERVFELLKDGFKASREALANRNQ